jgi:signal transduction histidine kinase/ligand-binding sensor domain-containing protein/DNA-binding response OmpR family regulator
MLLLLLLKNFLEIPWINPGVFFMHRLIKIIFLLLYYPILLFQQNQQIKFEHFTVDDGLSSTSAYCFLQDKKGLFWICTDNGLNRYDGYDFKVYKFVADNPFSLSHNFVLYLCEDSSGILWVGTKDGLNRYDREMDQFIRYKFDPDDANSLSNDCVTCIYEDKSGVLWIGTKNGLNRYNREQDNFTRILSGHYTPYSKELYNTIDSLKNNNCQLAGLSRVGNHQNLSASFTLDTNAVALLVGMGEGTNLKLYDYGWLETDSGVILWKMNYTSTFPAGDDLKNRIQTGLISLKKGKYRLRYKSNAKHCYHNWIGHSPIRSDLWGIQLYTIKSNSSEIPLILSTNIITAICEDHLSELWIGTFRGGINKINKERNGITYYHGEYGLSIDDFNAYHKSLPKDAFSPWLINDVITSICKTKNNEIWIATYLGLNKYSREKKGFLRFYLDKKDIISNCIYHIYEDQSGALWIGTYSGLYYISPQNSSIFPPVFEKFTQEKNNPHSISANIINVIYQDRCGVLWIAPWSGGINTYSKRRYKFKGYQTILFNPESLGNNTVNSFAMHPSDSGKVIWIGTDNGLDRFDRETGVFTHYHYDPNDPGSISYNHVGSICPDIYQGRPVLWLATGNGLNRFDMLSKRFYSKEDLNIPDLLKNYGLIHMQRSKEGFLWISTIGLYKYNTQEDIFDFYQVYSDASSDISIKTVRVSYEDKSGMIWVGTAEGLYRLDPVKNEFIHYCYDPASEISISNNDVSIIYEDSSGKLWIGTSNGLNRFDRDKNIFYCYNTHNGLPGNIIKGILEDNQGNLWVSTNNGLSIFNIKNETFKNYDVYDGLQDNEFQIRSCFKCPITGEMFLGTRNGFNCFYPDSICENQQVPTIIITDFKIHNKPVPINNTIITGDSICRGSPLTRQISETDQIILNYEQNYLSFTFSALDFNVPERNKYAYKMEDVDRDWIFTDASRRYATYTQLTPGEYIFRVKGSNNDGIWNDKGTSLRIIITPPWWQTSWAYLLYLLLFGSVVYSIWRFQTNRLKMKYRLEMEHLHAEKLQEMDHMKSRFFANISHEFRTPLTLIQGPVEQMLSGKFVGNIKEQYKIILRNSSRLLQLVNQLLDLSRLESGKLKLQAATMDVIELTRELVQNFESLAVRKKIELTFQCETGTLEAYIDRDKFEKIINNLLSNAFKFTPEGGRISVIIKHTPQFPLNRGIISPLIKGDKGGCIELSVTNTGTGIPADKIDHVFDRFYQVDNSYSKDQEGSGIGLALAKELVALHHGEITVESMPGKDTKFSVFFPLGKAHLQKDELVDISSEEEGSPLKKGDRGLLKLSHETFSKFPSIKEPAPKPVKGLRKGVAETTLEKSNECQPESTESRPIILIIEDNADVRHYMRSNLESDYQIMEAEDGVKGFEMAADKIPDLIISDVMMPEMDGYTLCKKLKNDERTSHIPLILLTARAAVEDKIEGLETGADDYLAKPFDTQELRVRIKNLIEQRRLLRKKFSKQKIFDSEEIAATPVDSSFLQRAKKIIENHLSDTEFSVEHFAGDIGLSRSQLHRKLRALIDHSPSELVRILRLQYAVTLLAGDKTIAEIAYEVGFNNPAYFSECFHKQFGKLPSEYKKMLAKNNI